MHFVFVENCLYLKLKQIESTSLGFTLSLVLQKSQRYRPMRNSCPPMTLPLTKSVSMLAISHRDIDGKC